MLSNITITGDFKSGIYKIEETENGIFLYNYRVKPKNLCKICGVENSIYASDINPTCSRCNGLTDLEIEKDSMAFCVVKDGCFEIRCKYFRMDIKGLELNPGNERYEMTLALSDGHNLDYYTNAAYNVPGVCGERIIRDPVESSDLSVTLEKTGNFYVFTSKIQLNIFKTSKTYINSIQNIFKKTKNPIQVNMPYLFILRLIYALISRRFFIFVYSTFMENSLNYIKNQPIGIKQNMYIQESLVGIIEYLVFIQSTLITNFPIICIVTGLDTIFLRLCICVTFKTFKNILGYFKQILDLFQNKTYNRVSMRYDRIILTIDQIIMLVLFFSMFILLLVNVVSFYCFFCVFYVIIKAQDAIDFLLYVVTLRKQHYYAYRDGIVQDVGVFDLIEACACYIRDSFGVSMVHDLFTGDSVDL